jgi:N-acetylglucosaminyl-diphospho-decaprenol L-rhamnosyltransferase
MAGDRPLVSAIVVSYETRDLTFEAVDSLLEFLPPESDVWVVDNASTDGSAEAIKTRYPTVKLVELPENIGFGRANNVALSQASGRFLLLLNSDARLVDAATIERLIMWMDCDPSLGMVGPRLEDGRGRLEYSARSFPTIPKEIVRRWGVYLALPRAKVGSWLLGDFWSPTSALRVDWITGACMLVRREAYEAVGGFNERIFMYGEEQEWARRFGREGWAVLYDPEVTVVHRRAASGSTGPWRVRAALEADVQIFRWTYGPLRALAFTVVRLTGFLFEAASFTAMRLVRRSDYVTARQRLAWQSFRQQLRIAARRPCG